MKIRIYTNLVYEGWNAQDLETGIGGSEEKIIELARELAKKHDVEVYHNGAHGTFDKVKYVDFRDFKPWEHSDVFISFKARQMLLQSINADKIFHFTADIEDWSNFDIQNVDQVVTISNWHTSRMGKGNIPINKLYLWADLERLDKNKVKKKKGTALYCSSFDRGLEELLVKWPYVKEKLGLKKLYVTYGWDFINKVIKGNPRMQEWKKRMIKLLEQDGIEQLGRLTNDEMCKMYWKSEYWIHPCNAPDNELFCINAVKAQYAECKPLVRRVGGMLETVHTFMDWDELMGEKVGKSTLNLEKNKKYVVENFDMKKQVKKFENLFKN